MAMDSASALLGLLDVAPGHGYDLKHGYDRLFGAKRPLAFGQVYAVLARFLRDGWIVLLAEEAGAGPDRKRYAITDTGRARVAEWLSTPDVPASTLQSNLLAKTIVALLLKGDAVEVLEGQRDRHTQRMRELTKEKRGAEATVVLACDLALFHVEADLRWIDLVEARLDDLRSAVLA